jgi:endonuclease-3
VAVPTLQTVDDLDRRLEVRFHGAKVVVDMPKPRTRRGRARETARRLAAEYPGTATELCALRHENPYELLIATILSAQTTDERVNQVTPELFRRYPTPADLAAADPDELEQLIRPTGFFRSKAKSLLGMARALEERFGGEVPEAMEDLVTIPGVGRKTANVVRSVGFGLPGLAVDTHVGRLSRRLGLTEEDDPVKVEYEINALLPPRELGALSLRLILHGRRVCVARRPRCHICLLNDYCPSAQVPVR